MLLRKLEKIGKTGLKVTGVNQSVIIIGDVHGYFWTLKKLLEKIPKDCLIVFVGDLIDRGPYSKQVVDLVKDRYFCVKGNHEDMMIKETNIFNESGKFNYNSLWLQGYVGGWDTLESYQFHDGFKKEILLEHAAWMEGLPTYIEFPEITNNTNKHLVVSHSSAERNWEEKHSPAYEWSFERSTLWSHLLRDPKCKLGYRNPKKIENVFNVFGHTPISNGPKIGRHFAAIDKGVFSNEVRGYGSLIGYQFPEGIVYEQKKVDKGSMDEQLETYSL